MQKNVKQISNFDAQGESAVQSQKQNVEQDGTAKLRNLMPIYDFVGLTIEQLSESVICSTSPSDQTSNHLGITHAGVLFTLGEAAAGIAVMRHEKLQGLSVVAKSVRIDFRHPAKSKIRAIAHLSDDRAKSIASEAKIFPKAVIQMESRLIDETDREIALVTCDFVLVSSYDR